MLQSGVPGMRPASHASKRSKFNSTVSHAVVCTVASEYRDSAFDSKMVSRHAVRVFS